MENKTANVPAQQAGKGFTKQEKSWILYDWANSVYATIMMAVVFPIYFTNMANAQLGSTMGDFWWSIATSVSMVIIALTSPFFGAIADFKGQKKKLFVFFLGAGLIFTLFSAIADHWVGMLIGYTISHFGFAGANLVYDSFLTDVTTPDRMDRVSSYGYALGYIGGSTIPFLFSIALIQFGELIGVDGTMAVKISLVITVVWWFIFTIPFLKNIHQVHYVEKPEKGIAGDVFRGVAKTAKSILKNKAILLFILAYFFYIDGVGTIINMSTSYGTTLGLNSTGMILALLVTQLVAFPCSILFSRLSKKYGSLQMLTAAVFIYLIICVVGFIMGFGLEEEWFGTSTGLVLFWVLAVMVGTVQGGIQAISRSHFGKLVPPQNSGEYFGFFDIFGKFASVMGPVLYAFTRSLTGRPSLSILSIVLLFLIALFILIGQRKTLLAEEHEA